jgi:hypothetical protein
MFFGHPLRDHSGDIILGIILLIYINPIYKKVEESMKSTRPIFFIIVIFLATAVVISAFWWYILIPFNFTNNSHKIESKQAQEESVANIYLLAFNLIRASFYLTTQESNTDVVPGKQKVMNELCAASWHMEHIKWLNNIYGSKLKEIKDKAYQTPESEWNKTFKDQLAVELRNLARISAEEFKKRQSNYQSAPCP